MCRHILSTSTRMSDQGRMQGRGCAYVRNLALCLIRAWCVLAYAGTRRCHAAATSKGPPAVAIKLQQTEHHVSRHALHTRVCCHSALLASCCPVQSVLSSTDLTLRKPHTSHVTPLISNTRCHITPYCLITSLGVLT